MLKLINENAYELKFGRSFTLKVHAKTDPVPGAWNSPIDLMHWIAEHSYVQSVEIVEVEK